MEVRVVEYEPAVGSGWTALSGAQRASTHHVYQANGRGGLDESAWLLRDEIRKDATFVGATADSLRVVLGEVEPASTSAVEAWLLQIFPEMDGGARPIVAKALSDASYRAHTLVGFPGRVYGLFVFRAGLPILDAGLESLRVVKASIMVMGNAVIVCWHDAQEPYVDATALIDSNVRQGRYTPDLGLPSAEVGSAYVTEIVGATKRVALAAAREVDEWESELFSTASKSLLAVGSGTSLESLGLARRAASTLGKQLDAIERGAQPGQHRERWRDHDMSPVAPALASRLGTARQEVDRLRADVTEAFMAVNSVAIAGQVLAARDAQKRAERLQRVVTLLTAFLLVPGLVATVFGADVALPGDSPDARLRWMTAMMVAGVLLALGLLTWLGRPKAEEPSSGRTALSDEEEK